MTVNINKADGTMEPFDPQKLHGSLRRAGAEEGVAQEVTHEVEREITEGMTTQEIYRRAFKRLREKRRDMAARYSLKRAVLEFGPSGFPFEGYLAELFKTEGYHTEVDQIIPGKCIEHEVDVVLKKNGELIYVEAKFHNTAGFKTDLQVTLYVQARLLDITAATPGAHPLPRTLIATNTKFTSFATRYASCVGMELLGWDYPAKGNLHERIERSGVYPITTLTSLSKREKTALLSQKVLLCKGLSHYEDALGRAGVPPKRLHQVLAEASALCSSGGVVQ